MTHDKPDLWLICGSQHLYGPEVLDQVRANAEDVARNLDQSPAIPLGVRLGALVTTPDEVRQVCLQANSDASCAGVVLWMHTFSPSRMWIGGLSVLAKPICHLHTQYNRDLPFDEIDMDFMNLNQAAHGDREAGHLHSRMRLERKVVVGHWSDPEVQERLGAWARAAHGWFDLQGAKFARFGDNMRYVAVTEGDKVGAELKFGFSVNGYGIGDLVERVDAVSENAVDDLVDEYQDRYDVAAALRPSGERHESLRDGARIELGMRGFLSDGGFKGFTTTFENLTGLKQLPGLAVQRLMADGYGFGAEGDWKTAALLRAMKVMADGLPGGTSFMEDYTYDLNPEGHRVLAAHMLEICESIASGKPALEIHPLGIGGKEDPVRLIFDAPAGPAINVSLVDLGNRFRLLVNDVEAVAPPPLPNLPVARALWEVQPDFKTGIAAWILAGGAHHTAFSYALTSEHIQDFAAIADVELAAIDADTRIRDFKRELRQNDLAFAFSRALTG